MLGKNHLKVNQCALAGSLLLAATVVEDKIKLSQPVSEASGLFTLMPFHFSKATTSGGFFLLLLDILILVSGVWLGSLLPDIDSKHSYLGRYVPWVEDRIGHRTWTHTVWALFLLLVLMFLLRWLILWGIFYGYLLHLIVDHFSRQGIIWFYPSHYYETNPKTGAVYIKGAHYPKPYYYYTGKMFERVIGNLCLVLSVVFYVELVIKLWSWH